MKRISVVYNGKDYNFYLIRDFAKFIKNNGLKIEYHYTMTSAKEYQIVKNGKVSGNVTFIYFGFAW